jgi:hypothetical protein
LLPAKAESMRTGDLRDLRRGKDYLLLRCGHAAARDTATSSSAQEGLRLITFKKIRYAHQS